MTADAIAFVAVGPDGIIRGPDLALDDLMSEETKGYDMPWMPEINEKLLGLRKGELVSFFSVSTTSERLLDAVTYFQRVKHKNLFLRKSCHQSPRPQPITSYTILYSGFICLSSDRTPMRHPVVS